MKFYKIRHKPSGLFYKPSKGGLNVSRLGKVYNQKPSLKRYQFEKILMGIGTIGCSKTYTSAGQGAPIYFTFDSSSWEIVEYQTRELVVPW